MPGVGQFIAGDARRGWRLLALDLTILATLLFFVRDTLSLVILWIKPSTLALMMAGNIILLGYRVWAADDAYHSAQAKRATGGSTSRAALLIGSLGLGTVLLLPHAVFGYYDVVQYDLINSVFSDNTVTSSRGPAPTQPQPRLADASAGTIVATPPDTTTTRPAPNFFGDTDRLNILLLGGDFGAGRVGIRTDTMITVSIDRLTGNVAMFSVPRNWTHAPLPVGMGVWECNCYPELINELWMIGMEYPAAFSGPGTPSENAVKGVISEFLGIPIHHYAMVNLNDFVELIDALGGIDIYVPSRVIDDEYPHEDGSVERLEIDTGWQKMNGHVALAYARSRSQDSDYFRMNRQRCVIEAMIAQTDPVSLILNFGSLADVIKRTVLTDIPIDALPQLIKLLPAMDIDNIVSVRFIPPEYHLSYRDDGEPGRIANIDLVHEHVQLIIADPDRAVRELGLEQLDDVCGEPGA